MRGRKRARKIRRIKTIFNSLIITTTLGIMFVLGMEEYKESKIKKQRISDNKQYNAQYINVTYKKDENQEIEEKEEQKKPREYPKEEIPEIIIKLVENQIKIYGVKEEEKSLEQAFFEKTGGNVIE